MSYYVFIDDNGVTKAKFIFSDMTSREIQEEFTKQGYSVSGVIGGDVSMTQMLVEKGIEII